jgi:hypothetical protein
MFYDPTDIGFFEAKAVISQSDLVVRPQSYFLGGGTVDSHTVRAVTVNNLPVAVRCCPNQGVLTRNAVMIENQRAGFCTANRDWTVSGELENAGPFAGATNHKSRHPHLP